MFRRHYHRRRFNIVFVIFRMMLSVVMFAVLVGGIYSAYKHFSGLDPLKLDPRHMATNLLQGKLPQNFLEVLSKVTITQSKNHQILGQSPKNLAFKFLLVADSHSDNVNLKKALSLAKQSFPDIQFIIGMGDYTEVGTLDEMRKVKNEFDSLSLRYFLLPGDHDLWDSRDKHMDPTANFRQVFGLTFQSFTFADFKFILIFNSDNYAGMGEEQLKWLNQELEKGKEKGIFVFVHEPFFHPSSDHVMGRIEKDLKHQARNLIHTLSEYGVKKVFAGDTHYFSEYSEPETKLPMVTIGAITTDRNPQAPRFAVVSVYEDGSTKVEDVEIH